MKNQNVRMNPVSLFALALLIPLLLMLNGCASSDVSNTPSEGTEETEETANTERTLPPANERFSSLAQIEQNPAVKRRPLDIQHWQTTHGARVYFMAAPELPMLDLRIVFDGGSARDGNQAGVAMLTSSLIGEGTQQLNSRQIAQGFEGLGAEFGSSSYRDMAILSLRSLTDSNLLEPALALFLEVTSQPTFPAEAVTRTKNQALASLQYQKQQTGKLANLAFFSKLYGTHPYASPSQGTEQSIRDITRNDLQHFFERYYVASNAVISLVGDLDRAQAEIIAERASRSLAAGERAPALPDVSAPKTAINQHIDHNSQQTQIIVGGLGIARGDDDYVALYVGNEILGGGGFGSRLMEEIREKRGLSYGVYSYFSPMHSRGPFLVSLKTRADQSEQALQVVNDTLSKFLSEGPSEQELITAKQNILGSFPLSTASNRSIVGQLGSIGFYDLPLDHLDRFLTRVEQVDRQQIREAFQRYIDNDKLITITVGQPLVPETVPETVPVVSNDN